MKSYNVSIIGGTAECNGQHRCALFTIERHLTIFSDCTNRYSVDSVSVAVIVTVITGDATVAASNHVNGSVSMATELNTMSHAVECDVLWTIDCFAVILRTPATAAETMMYQTNLKQVRFSLSFIIQFQFQKCLQFQFSLRFYLFYSLFYIQCNQFSTLVDLLICYHYCLTHVWATVMQCTNVLCVSGSSVTFYCNVCPVSFNQINGDGDINYFSFQFSFITLLQFSFINQ